MRYRLVRLILLLTVAVCGPARAEGSGGGGHDHAAHAARSPAAGGSGFFADFFKVYVPRSQCMYGERPLIGAHVASDLLIAASYYSIPIALIYFVRRRRDVAFNWMFVMFAGFILACGTTHLFGIWAIWQPLYRLDALVKIFTAGISVVTAVMLWPLIPKALALPSPAQLEARVRERTDELDRANASLGQLLERERSAREEAERAGRVKDEFLATLSHELRTPLTAIYGWAQMLRRADPADDDEVAGAAVLAPHQNDLAVGLEVIERNARVQARLIEDLLDMGRIISGKIRLDVAPVDLSAIVEDVVRSTAPAAAAKDLRVRTVTDPNAGPVSGDAARLQQVVWNLLTNAIKFTPKHGKIEVTLRQVDSHVELAVADTGEGIAADLLPHVFERFRQGDSSSTRRHGGLGLGLSIVRHLAELHGGTVRAMSEGEGRGSTFVVNLPLRAVRSSENAEGTNGAIETAADRQPVRSAAVAPSEAIPSLAGIRVLVVDDEPDARDLLRRVLEEHGAAVVVAGSAAEAIELLDREHRESPHVLLSDIGMPVVDGYGLIRRLRERPAERCGALPAVALTAFARAEDRVKSMLAGFQVHLSKPVEPAELLVVVARLAGR